MARRSKALPSELSWEDVEPGVERLDGDELVALVHHLLAHIPGDQHAALLDGWIDVRELSAAGTSIRTSSPSKFVDEVRKFYDDTLAGEHHESFNVNSKNWMQKSDGTKQWIRLMEKYVDRSVQLSTEGHHESAVRALNLLLDLLDGIDHGEDYVFFADEQGSWQVGIDWEVVFPAYFTSLSAIASLEDFAGIVADRADCLREEDVLGFAMVAASEDQRAALSNLPRRRRS